MRASVSSRAAQVTPEDESPMMKAKALLDELV